MKTFLRLLLVLCFAVASSAVLAQDTQTKGSITGQVLDAQGGAIPGAAVKVTGGLGERSTTTNELGLFSVESLIPGTYKVRVEKSGFKSAEVATVTVFVGKAATTNIALEAGNISETVNVTAGAGIDQASTAVGSNLNDQLYSNIPVARSVTSLFYLAPGTTDSLGGGRANPSIAGGSALDNLYIADGVNITDSAFGGLGTFSRSYGSLGTGINTSFIKEVQVKTGGFEPQYGQAEGGIVNIITQSGTNDFHGAVYGYTRPHQLEGDRQQPDDFRAGKGGETVSADNYDAGVDMGGAIIKNKLFFFGSFNPSVSRNNLLGANNSKLFIILGEHSARTRTLNYASKLDWNINSNHSINFSLFGDPSRTNKSSFSTLAVDNTTAQSVLDYGTRNLSLRYNGNFGNSASPYTLSASFSQGVNHFNETGFDNFNQIVDRTQTTFPTQRQSFTAIGLGFIEPTNGKTYRTTLDLTKQFNLWGSHTVDAGYQFQRGIYNGVRDRSGPHYAVPATNADGTALGLLAGGGASAVGQQLNATWALRLQAATCTLCPLMLVPGDTTNSTGLGVGLERVSLQQTRGEFGTPAFGTFSNYNTYYIGDTWRINKHLTAIYGLRGEQERIVGNPGSTGKRIAYSFTDQWAPRVGVTFDPTGKGNTKIFYNFGRYFEYLPLDLAERSLSSEKDFTGARFAPDFSIPGAGTLAGQRVVNINSFGTVTPVVDSAHLLSGAANGTSNGLTISAQDPSNPILPGTKLGFAQEHVIGFEQQLSHGLVFSARYQDRRLKRIVEDAAVVSPEAANFFGQTYFIGNVTAKLDAAVNPISHIFTPVFDPVSGAITNTPGICNPSLSTAVRDNFGALLGGVCYETNGKNGKAAGSSGADGVADGFADPVHIYKALEIELNKRFSNGWQMLTNYRFSTLRGNYEGHFRNDNGQTDPGISSLFDFTQGDFNLLGNQFAVGPLNTDRAFVANIYGSYSFSKERGLKRFNGLNLGAGLHMESGVPLSKFGAHPVYLNAGEVPIGGRGSLGRSSFYPQLDFHADYPWKISERMKLMFVGDVFNVFNNTSLRLINQSFETAAGVVNPDFTKPVSFHLPANIRLGLRLEF
jgi:hypothetical protein